MTDRPEPVAALLKGSAWASVQAELELQARLLAAVRGDLPDSLAPHCRHCVASAERLIVYADSPAFASQLRFCGPNLLAAVESATGRRFREFRVRTVLDARPRPDPTPPAPAVTAGTAAALVRESAATAASTDIKEALLRLGRTLDRARGG
jgi:hypothetical protein